MRRGRETHMSNHALIIGWNRAVPGKEKQALEGFQRSMAVYLKAQMEKKIDSFEPILLFPHGGDLNGFILVKGDREKLHAWRHSDEFMDLMFEAMQYLDGLGVNDAMCGEKVGHELQRWAKFIK
jgi:hypothetical protein